MTDDLLEPHQTTTQGLPGPGPPAAPEDYGARERGATSSGSEKEIARTRRRVVETRAQRRQRALAMFAGALLGGLNCMESVVATPATAERYGMAIDEWLRSADRLGEWLVGDADIGSSSVSRFNGLFRAGHPPSKGEVTLAA